MDLSEWGIPYAHYDLDDPQLPRICPVCGERIVEDSDEFGENTTNRYGEHYAEKHAAD